MSPQYGETFHFMTHYVFKFFMTRLSKYVLANNIFHCIDQNNSILYIYTEIALKLCRICVVKCEIDAS